MKILCPVCRSSIRSEGVNVGGLVAYCARCHEVFSLENVVSKPPRMVTAPPWGTPVELARGREQLAIVLPPSGMRSTGLLMLVVGLIMSIFTVGLSTAVPKQMPEMASAYLALVALAIFSILPLAMGTYLVFGDTAIIMTRRGLLFERRLFGLRRREIHTLDSIHDIRRIVLFTESKNDDDVQVPIYGIGIWVGRNRLLKFGGRLSEYEHDWLIGEMHDFWNQYRVFE